MKRRDFLIRSAIGSSFAANRLLGATVSRPPKRAFSTARAARSGDGGLVTPLLFFSRTDIPQLLRDVKGVKQTLWRRVQEAANQDLERDPLQPDTSSKWAVREFCAIDREQLVKRCAFAYLITGDERYQRRAHIEVAATLGWERWIDVANKGNFGNRQYGLMNGTVSAMLAFYLDWCGPGISSEERVVIIENFKVKAAEPLLRDMDRHVAYFGTSVNNHIPWMVHGSGLMALLLLEEDPLFEEVLEKCVFHLRRYLDWINPDGSTDEGGRYWMWGIKQAAHLMDALRVNADRLPKRLQWEQAAKLYKHKPATSDGSPLKKTAYFPLYCIQRTQMVVDFGDTPVMSAGPMQSLFYWFARMWRNNHFQWQGDQVTDTDPMACVWYDPTVPAKAPDDIPVSKAFHGAGWGIVRSDLTNPDGFLLAIRTGDNNKSHQHYDLGTFILRAFGRGLIIDSGLPEYSIAYWSGQNNYKRSTLGHNCILVDGKGQRKGAQNRAAITRLQDFGDTKYLAVDAHCPSNGIELHRRLFAMDLTNPRNIQFTLKDDVRLRKNAEVTWLFHFEDVARVDDDLITITNGPARLTLRALSSLPLQMSIEQDHPVPFVCIKTKNRRKSHELILQGEIKG